MLHKETLNAIPLNDYEKVCNSCTIYIVLFAVFFITSICISSAFICFHWYLKNDDLVLRLILVLKQKLIEGNSMKHINGKHQTN